MLGIYNIGGFVMLKAEEIAENLKVSVNGYNILEDYVVEHPNDKKALCFACKLYEQFEEYLNDDQSRLSHIQFWMNHAEDYFLNQTEQGFGGGRNLSSCSKFRVYYYL